ncbi:MAG: LysE family transporter [Anaerolineae bacterium]
MLALFLSAFGLGIAFCAPPGAVTAEAVRRGLARGFWPALLLELGSLIGDVTWAAIALAGAAFLVQSMQMHLILAFLGCALLLRLSWIAFKHAWLGSMPEARGVSHRSDFATGATLSLANPFAIAFWLGMGGTIVVGTGQERPEQFAVFLSGFLCAGFTWAVFLAALVAWGRCLVGRRFFRAVNLLCGSVLGYFGARLLWSTLSLLL